MRILVVDDEPFILELAVMILKAEGHELTVASDGQEGMEKFKKGTFDLVLTDFNMPRVNGVELAKEIKAVEPTARIILMSGLLEKAREAGNLTRIFDLVLEKPIRIDSLVTALSKATAKPPLTPADPGSL